MELSEEERQMILRNRKTNSVQKNAKVPQGIGTGRPWAIAQIGNKKFIDEATYIEEPGNAE